MSNETKENQSKTRDGAELVNTPCSASGVEFAPDIMVTTGMASACAVGINGKRYGNLLFSDPKDARDEVERIISRLTTKLSFERNERKLERLVGRSVTQEACHGTMEHTI